MLRFILTRDKYVKLKAELQASSNEYNNVWTWIIKQDFHLLLLTSIHSDANMVYNMMLTLIVQKHYFKTLYECRVLQKVPPALITKATENG